MTIALIDNGSLEPAAHRHLRGVADAVSVRVGATVHAVSWKHSDKLSPELLDNTPAWTLSRWVRSQFETGEREFLFIPFLVSADGAIASALHGDLENLREELGSFDFGFIPGLAERGVLSVIVADRIHSTLAARNLDRPAVIVVDHGGPSPASAALRDRIAAEAGIILRLHIGALAAASMEGGSHAHNHPLLKDRLAQPPFDTGDVVLAPLFLSPGRHAGSRGDLARIAEAAEMRPGSIGLRCHFTELPGTHPLAIEALAASLRDSLSQRPPHLHELHA